VTTVFSFRSCVGGRTRLAERGVAAARGAGYGGEGFCGGETPGSNDLGAPGAFFLSDGPTATSTSKVRCSDRGYVLWKTFAFSQEMSG
jgi:hypothetical protein